MKKYKVVKYKYGKKAGQIKGYIFKDNKGNDNYITKSEVTKIKNKAKKINKKIRTQAKKVKKIQEQFYTSAQSNVIKNKYDGVNTQITKFNLTDFKSFEDLQKAKGRVEYKSRKKKASKKLGTSSFVYIDRTAKTYRNNLITAIKEKFGINTYSSKVITILRKMSVNEIIIVSKVYEANLDTIYTYGSTHNESIRFYNDFINGDNQRIKVDNKEMKMSAGVKDVVSKKRLNQLI